MKQRNKVWERILCMADLSGEQLPGLPLAELVGEHRVLIENHQGVHAYGPEEIRISVAFGSIVVSGNHLELACMTGERLIITGTIESIHLYKRRS